MDLFVNFKLKVKEAEELGLDTNLSFITELEGYRKQLAKPYLRNNDFDEAANQMIDSAWHKQTTSRCESLAATMRGSNK